MSSTIQTIAVAGPSGNVGKTAVETLVAAGFSVVLLQRTGSKSSLPTGPNTQVKTVDYTSRESLVDALKGVQGIVSLLSGPALDLQPGLIDAAIEVGVKRFIPSEFGSNTLDPKLRAIPFFNGKTQTLEYLQQKAAQTPDFSYTALLTGPFLDFCLQVALVADPKNRKALVVDDGNAPFSATPIPEVAKAIVGVFRNLDTTKNRCICTESYRTTQNQIIRIGEKLTGTTWAVERTSSKDELATGWQELRQEQPDHHKAAFAFIRYAIFGGETGSDFGDKVGNDLVGLKRLSDSDLEAEVKKWL